MCHLLDAKRLISVISKHHCVLTLRSLIPSCHLVYFELKTETTQQNNKVIELHNQLSPSCLLAAIASDCHQGRVGHPDLSAVVEYHSSDDCARISRRTSMSGDVKRNECGSRPPVHVRQSNEQLSRRPTCACECPANTAAHHHNKPQLSIHTSNGLG